MDLLPVAADYDTISDKMREFAAARYMEIISQLSNYVNQALHDPDGIHDIEPGRLQAHVALVKLQTTLIKELGLLYRVQDRPREEPGEDLMAVAEHERLLELAEAEALRREERAAELARTAALAAVADREVLDLGVARERVARGLRALGR